VPTPLFAFGVQLYLSDPVAQVVRPARWLAGFVRVPLAPGEGAPGHLPAARRPDRVYRPGPDPVVEPGETSTQ
jgi:beta-xylosidase